MTPAQVLLQERIDDLRHNGGAFVGVPGHPEPTGTVRTTVDYLLTAAGGALSECQDEDCDGIATAIDHVDAALEALMAYRARLSALDDLDEEEKMFKVGATKDERGGWTMPADETEAQATA